MARNRLNYRNIFRDPASENYWIARVKTTGGRLAASENYRGRE